MMLFATIGLAMALGQSQDSVSCNIPPRSEAIFRITLPAKRSFELDFTVSSGHAMTFRGGDRNEVVFAAVPNLSNQAMSFKVVSEISGLTGKPLPLAVTLKTNKEDHYEIQIGTDKTITASVQVTIRTLGKEFRDNPDVIDDLFLGAVRGDMTVPPAAPASGVPVLTDIPVLGPLFQNSGSSTVPPPTHR
ncbi:MAG TPA: hypothetical protein VHE55_11435 [Fimbriimonadaceae bacterium]|nr:hypothetical protein [Fimbriimonadaceae bacterium]